MYSVDPKVYDAHKKSDKKTVGESKKPKSVSGAQIFSRFCFGWMWRQSNIWSSSEFAPEFVFDMFYLSHHVK